MGQMKQDVSKRLYGYWNGLRKGRPAPERNEVEPGDIRDLLGDTFILQASGNDFRFRLAGTRLCALYCRELKGQNFLSMWKESDREAIESLLTAIHHDAAAAVVGMTGRSDRGNEVPLEIVLLPLSQKDSGFTRILGACAPTSAPYWVGMHPVMKQEITSLRMIWPDEVPFFLRTADQAALEPEIEPITTTPRTLRRPAWRQVRHLTVYEGGRN